MRLSDTCAPFRYEYTKSNYTVHVAVCCEYECRLCLLFPLLALSLLAFEELGGRHVPLQQLMPLPLLFLFITFQDASVHVVMMAVIVAVIVMVVRIIIVKVMIMMMMMMMMRPVVIMSGWW